MSLLINIISLFLYIPLIELSFYVMDIEKIRKPVILTENDQLTVIYQRGALWFKCADDNNCGNMTSLNIVASPDVVSPSPQNSLSITVSSMNVQGRYIARSDGVNSSLLSFLLIVKDLIRKSVNEMDELTFDSLVEVNLPVPCASIRKNNVPYSFSLSLYDRFYCVSEYVLRIHSVEWSDVGEYYSRNFQFSILSIKEPFEVSNDTMVEIDFSVHSALILPPATPTVCLWHIGSKDLNVEQINRIYALKSGRILIERYAGEIYCKVGLNNYAYNVKPIVLQISFTSDSEFFIEGIPGNINCNIHTSANVAKIQIRSHLAVLAEIEGNPRTISFKYNSSCYLRCTFRCIVIYESHHKLRSIEKSLSVPIYTPIRLTNASMEVEIEMNSNVIINYQNSLVSNENMWWTVNKNILAENVFITTSEIIIKNVTEMNEGSYYAEITNSSFIVKVMTVKLLPIIWFEGAVNNSMVILVDNNEPSLICKSIHPRILSVSIAGNNILKGVFKDHCVANFPLKIHRNSGEYTCISTYLTKSQGESSHRISVSVIFSNVITQSHSPMLGESWSILNPSLFAHKSIWILNNESINSNDILMSQLSSTHVMLDENQNLILLHTNESATINLSLIVSENVKPIIYSIRFSSPNITLSIEPSNHFILEDTSQDFNCSLANSSELFSYRIFWYKGNDAGNLFPSIQTAASSNISFSPAKYSDTGLYYCVVEYHLEKNSPDRHFIFDHWIKVIRRIKLFISGGETALAYLGQILNITCTFETEHVVSSYWMRNNETIPTSFGDSDIIHNIPVVYYNSSGMYDCLIKNEVEERSASLQLTVKDSIEIQPFESETLYFEIGDEITATCRFVVKVDGLETLRELKKLNCENCQLNIIHTKNLIQMIINRAKMEDAGEYECGISSDYSHIKRSFNIFVLNPIKIKQFSTQKLLVEVNTNLEVDCEFTGDEIISATWLDNQGKIKTENEGQNPLRLSILKATEDFSGRYTCVVANRIRTRSLFINVTVIGVQIKLVDAYQRKEVKRASTQNFVCNIIILNPLENMIKLVNKSLAITGQSIYNLTWNITTDDQKEIHLGKLSLTISREMENSMVSCWANWSMGELEESHDAIDITNLVIVEDPEFVTFRINNDKDNSSIKNLECIIRGTHITKIMLRVSGMILIQQTFNLDDQNDKYSLGFNISKINISSEILCTVIQQVNMDTFEFSRPIEITLMSVTKSTYVAIGSFSFILLIFLITGILVWRSCFVSNSQNERGKIKF